MDKIAGVDSNDKNEQDHTDGLSQGENVIMHNKKLVIVMMCAIFMLFAQVPDPFSPESLQPIDPVPLWTKTYGTIDDDWGYSVQQTSDGGYIIAGVTGSTGSITDSGDTYLIKTDDKGDTLWTKKYGGDGFDKGYSVQQTSDGGYIIAGGTSSNSPTNVNAIYLIKTDFKGETIWTQTYGTTGWGEGYSVQETVEGGYIIAGTKNNDIYIIKTDDKGDTLWTKTYGEEGVEKGYSVKQTSDGGYIITGCTSGSAAVTPSDVYLLRTDTLGDSLWTKIYGGAYEDRGYSVNQTSDGGYIITGVTGPSGAGIDSGDVYLIKTDSLGATLWTKKYGGRYYDRGNSVYQTQDGGYIIAGYTASFGNAQHDVYLIKTDSLGDTLWTETFGGEDNDWGYSLNLTSDGGYIIAGVTHSYGAGNDDMYVIKTAPVIRMLSPNGGEMLQGGSVHTIEWCPENTPANVYCFQLFFSSDGGDSFPEVIEKDINPNVQEFEWTVPTINSRTCRVKLELLDDNNAVIAKDISDNNFVIDISAPVIDSTTVLHDTSYSGPFEILTKVSDNCAGVDSVLLYYKRDEDRDWIAVVMYHTGFPLWYVDSIPRVSNPGDTVRYYIKAIDGAGHTATDPDDAPIDYYAFAANITGIVEHGVIPTLFSFGLHSNPVNGHAIFHLSMPTDARVTLRIYDVTGRRIATPITGMRIAGYYEIFWNATVSSGIYFYVLESPWQVERGKLVLIH